MLKKIVFIMSMMLSSLMASEVNWEKDFNSGIKKAKELNKPVLFISSRHTCKYCVILDETTLKDKRVIKALNRDYISIISYSDENDYLPKKLWSPGTPAIWFLMPDSEPMYAPIPGAIGAEQFLEALAIVKTEFAKREKR
ncbi:MAG: thioredoxin family protein [Campylobacterota bacterium]|nr:thioredoxin family protein [Campylobacterota bacterium]